MITDGDIKLKYSRGEYICKECDLLGGEDFRTMPPDGALDHVRRHRRENEDDVSDTTLDELSLEVEKCGLQTTLPTIYGNLRMGAFECSEGWYNLLRIVGSSIHQLLEQHQDGPPEAPVIVKEKFGVLEIQPLGFDVPSEINNQVMSIIDYTRRLSSGICEICGRRGERCSDRHWIKTLCEYHA